MPVFTACNSPLGIFFCKLNLQTALVIQTSVVRSFNYNSPQPELNLQFLALIIVRHWH